jgi:tetratricopeptide (TPR) repeat protein
VDGFSHSLEIARRMVVKDPNDANWQRNLANGYQQIGEVCQAKGNLSAAADAFAKTVQIYENLASQYPSNAERKHQLTGSWRKIGEAYQVQGNVKDAAYAFAHVSQLTPQAPDLGQENPEWITNRCSDIAERISCKIRNEERDARGDLEGAAEAFLRSLQAAQRLAS